MRHGAGERQATTYEVQLSPVAIDPRVNRPRAPVLPAAARGRDFERRFDQVTLFNDVFWEDGGDFILAIGPHLPSHLDPEADVRFHCLESGHQLHAEFLPSREHLHGDMFRIAPSRRTSAFRIMFGAQQVIVPVQPNLSPLLAGRRVLTNRCQDDPLEWLVDWAYFHAQEFGFDAIVHYDNLSTAYSPDDVRFALANVPGIDVVIVLSWPFPMEPAHAVVPGTGQLFWQAQLKDRWAESCRLEHQRRRFLQLADFVLVADVDELLVQRNPNANIDDLFADPHVAWVKCNSELVVNTNDPRDRLMRHRDLHWVWDNQSFKTPKYLVKPNRCPDSARWWLHSISDAPWHDVPETDFTIAHFYALSTGWGGKHDRTLKHIPSPETHHVDMQLRETLDRVFDIDHPAAATWSPPPNENPHLLRREAYTLMRSGNRSAALNRVNRAIALDPYHPIQHQVRNELLTAEPTSPDQPTSARG
jgi:hypothetical protein